MQITVKSVKLLKKGTNDYGEWKLVSIVTAEDVKYTTLAKGAEAITPGSTINITDMDKDGKGRESFKKYEIISEGMATQAREATGGDSLEKRQSIENQTRAYIIADLFKAEKLEAESSQVLSLLDWLDKLGSPMTKVESPKAEEKLVEGEEPLKNLGELYTRAKKYGLSTRDVCEAVGVGKGEDIKDFEAAWEMIVANPKYASIFKK